MADGKTHADLNLASGRASALKELVRLSKYAGMREDLVQAGGGNSSVKMDDTRMLIKASGIQLADLSEDRGYSVVDYGEIGRYMDALLTGTCHTSADQILADALVEGKRPSIETFLHAITKRVTLHTHSSAVNVLTARRGGMESLGEMFPGAVLVGYATPGLELAKLYVQAYTADRGRAEQDHVVVFLKNHGLVVSGDTAQAVIRETERICRTVEEYVGLDNAPYRRAYEVYDTLCQYGLGEDKIIVKAENKTVLDAYARMGYQLWNYQICPDCVVFCGMRPFRLTKEEDARAFVQRYGSPVLIQDGKDLFLRAESVKRAREIESVLAFSAQVILHNEGYQVDSLSDAEQRFLLNWDAETYRKNIK